MVGLFKIPNESSLDSFPCLQWRFILLNCPEKYIFTSDSWLVTEFYPKLPMLNIPNILSLYVNFCPSTAVPLAKMSNNGKLTNVRIVKIKVSPFKKIRYMLGPKPNSLRCSGTYLFSMFKLKKSSNNFKFNVHPTLCLNLGWLTKTWVSSSYLESFYSSNSLSLTFSFTSVSS